MPNAKTYETHFEMAKRTGYSPETVRQMALSFELGDFGSAGGVIYLPLNGSSMGFFQDMMRIRYSARHRI